MGKRSRSRQAPRSAKTEGAGKKPTLRERRDAASRVAERQIKARPKAPWDPFPLTELAIFSGLVLLIVGAVIGGPTGKGLITSGVVLACIGGLETILREHFGGYRSHSGILAAMAALAVLTGASMLFGVTPAVSAAVAIGVFAVAFPTLRSAFIRKSGGRGVL